jgi:hypothetical protein
VPELLARVGGERELHELIAFLRIEPRGARRDDLRIGYATAVLRDTLIALWVKDRPKPTVVEDVTISRMFWRKPDDEELSDEQAIAYAKSLAIATGGQILEPGDEE